jgi:Protein of Unknown function (DUF2784)
VHLSAIGIVVAEALAGIPCPLTVWEKKLRATAGQASYPGDFLGHWAHQLISYHGAQWVFTLLHVLFGLAVLEAFVLAPPRWPGRVRSDTPEKSGTPATISHP